MRRLYADEEDENSILASEKTAGCILPRSLNVLSPCWAKRQGL